MEKVMTRIERQLNEEQRKEYYAARATGHYTGWMTPDWSADQMRAIRSALDRDLYKIFDYVLPIHTPEQIDLISTMLECGLDNVKVDFTTRKDQFAWSGSFSSLPHIDYSEDGYSCCSGLFEED